MRGNNTLVKEKLQKKAKFSPKWFEINHQRNFLDNLYQKFRFQSNNDWFSISKSKIAENGGRPILNIYKGNIIEMISKVYPDYQFKYNVLKTRAPKRFWNSIDNQKLYLDHLYEKMELKSLKEWYSINNKIIIQNNGGGLLKKYNGNFFECLKVVYPNYEWNNLNRSHLSKGFWNSIENQQNYLDNLFQILNFKFSNDWLNVNSKTLIDNGGSGLLNKYRSDIPRLITSVYPHLSPLFSNVQNILNQYNTELNHSKNIKNNNDNNIEKMNINNIVHNKPNVNSNNEIISKEKRKKRISNWKKTSEFYVERQREIFNQIEKKYNIKTHSDWYKYSKLIVKKNGGSGILRLYNGSLYQSLKSIYPSFQWELTKFSSHEKWEYIHMNIKEYLLSIQKRFKVERKEDWFRISNLQLDRENFGLFQKVGGIFYLLKSNYPSESWNELEFSFRLKKSSQRWLFICMKEIYPNVFILEEYYHPQIRFITESMLNFDIFIPSLNLAIEYQGEQHFDDIYCFTPTNSCQLKDIEKNNLTKSFSIQFLIIPFWWDCKLSSLLSHLNK